VTISEAALHREIEGRQPVCKALPPYTWCLSHSKWNSIRRPLSPINRLSVRSCINGYTRASRRSLSTRASDLHPPNLRASPKLLSRAQQSSLPPHQRITLGMSWLKKFLPLGEERRQGISFGFQVLKNTNKSIAIEPWFDFICGINGRLVVRGAAAHIRLPALPMSTSDKTQS
jgi:hypothetical protein